MKRSLSLLEKIEKVGRNLYDASAIINLVRKEKLEAFLKGSTLDLALHEVTNTIWREFHLSGRE